MITMSYYEWAILNHKSWTKDGEKYKISKSQMEDFETLLDDLLKNKSETEAKDKLPSITGKYDNEYWDDVQLTESQVSSKVTKMSDTDYVYYYGTLPN